MTLERKDFGYSYGSTGYMLYFREKPIGGAGITDKCKNGGHARSNIKMFGEQARQTIDELMQGNGDMRFWTAINKILEQS